VRTFNAFEENEIAHFLGLPDADKPAIDRSAKPMDSLVELLIERYHLDRETPEEVVLRNWTRIVGENFANRCYPERISQSGSLIVAVPNTVVRRELMFMEDRILTALGSLPGCGHIRAVVLKSGH
jgi:hypothetical protein